MDDLPPEEFLSRKFSAPAIRLIIGQPERWRTLLWLVLWLVGIPLSMIGYLSMLLWAYGAAG
jgi:hypothetical protein